MKKKHGQILRHPHSHHINRAGLLAGNNPLADIMSPKALQSLQAQGALASFTLGRKRRFHGSFDGSSYACRCWFLFLHISVLEVFGASLYALRRMQF